MTVTRFTVYVLLGVLAFFAIVAVNVLIALVIQFIWNGAIVKTTGVGEISLFMAWLIGLVIYWLFGPKVTVRR